MSYLFRWKIRSVRNPYNPRHTYTRAMQYTLICNGCDEAIARATPGNFNGLRYFLFMAERDARSHLEHCRAQETKASAARRQPPKPDNQARANDGATHPETSGAGSDRSDRSQNREDDPPP